MDAVTHVPVPVNETIQSYAPGSAERGRLEQRLKDLQSTPVELSMAIGGKRRLGSGGAVDVVQPHNHRHVLGTLQEAVAADAEAAVDAARKAARAWRSLSYDDRAAVILKAADLLAGPYRETINAATMLGQSKTVYQAEIDAACELIDFLRFNVGYGRRLLEEQPASSSGIWNRLDQRPLEGFVYAVTPFNFTAIAGNLPTAPALMGNVVVWKPAHTQQFAAHVLMEVLEEAGLPPGVINMVTGGSKVVSDVLLDSPELAGVHFTGSTAVFQMFWNRIGANISRYRSYPRIVGETGGKDFVVAHPSADADVLRTALTRGAFEYQGQKCSAASRAYIPRSIWTRMRDDFVAEVDSLSMGDVTDLSNFMGAVIDDRSFAKLKDVVESASADSSIEVVAGGTVDDSQGWFVRPTVLVGSDPGHDIFRTEYFGPVLAVHVYDDGDFEAMLDQMENVSPYALTGSVIAQDRAVIARTAERLRFAAGNFYVNDKPTGAVVGQQPFGGGRASGTNDKAGGIQNMMRWVSPRSIKETFVPPTDYRYPHMD